MAIPSGNGIIARLSFRWSFVIVRNSSLSYKGEAVDVQRFIGALQQAFVMRLAVFLDLRALPASGSSAFVYALSIAAASMISPNRYVPVTASAFRYAILNARPAGAGVKPRHWKNVLSGVRRAIRLSDLGGKKPALQVPLTDDWERLVTRLDMSLTNCRSYSPCSNPVIEFQNINRSRA